MQLSISHWLPNMLPLYFIMILGAIASRKLAIPRDAVGRLLMYILTPVVTFGGAASVTLDVSKILLPIWFFAAGCSLSLIAYGFYFLVYRTEPERNILAYMAGTGNSGYFGLPVVILLLGQNGLGSAVFAIMGFTLFENTLGFYLIARGHFSPRQSIQKLIRLPSVYAFFAGILANLSHLFPGLGTENFFIWFRGAYTVLGMMLVGMGMATLSKFKFDISFLLGSFLFRFFLWPLISGLLIFVDKRYFHIFDNEAQVVIFALSVVPLAANSMAFAAELKAAPEKTAFVVVTSTLFALLFIPGAVWVFVNFIQ